MTNHLAAVIMIALLFGTPSPASAAPSSSDETIEADRMVEEGRFEEGLSLAMRIAEAGGPDRPLALAVAARAHLYMGDLTAGRRLLDEAVEAAAASGDAAGEAIARSRRSTVLIMMGDSNGALEDLRMASRLATGDPWAEGEAAMANANLYSVIGRTPEAEEGYRTAADSFRRAGRDDRAEAANTNLADLYINTGRIDEVEAMAREGLSSPSTPNTEAYWRYYLGRALDLSGRTAEAETEYIEAIRLYEETGNRRSAAITRVLLAGILTARGELAASDEMYEAAIEALSGGGDIISAMQGSVARGQVLVLLGRFQEAIDLLSAAAGTAEEAGDRMNAALAHRNLGVAYQSLSVFDRAAEEYDAAARFNPSSAYIERALLNDRLSLAAESGDAGTARNGFMEALDDKSLLPAQRVVLLGNLAHAAMRMGDLDEAERALDEADDLARTSGLAYEIPSIENRRGIIALGRGDLRAVEELGERALAEARESMARDEELVALILLGVAAHYSGDPEDGIDRLEEAIGIIEDYRADVSSDAAREGLIARYEDLYALLVDWLIEEGRSGEAFEYLERSRARRFLDVVASGPPPEIPRSREEIEEEARLRERMEGLRAAAGAAGEGGSVMAPDAASGAMRSVVILPTEELAEAEGEYEAFIERLRDDSPEVADLVSVNTLSADEIRAILPDNTVFVSYILPAAGVGGASARSAAFVVTRDDVSVRFLDATLSGITEKVDAWRNEVTRGAPGTAESLALYEDLIRPIEDLLPEEGTILFSPQGPLHYLSFAALFDGERYLIERNPVGIIPSANVIRFLSEREVSPSESFLGFANPSTDLADLPFAEEEVSAITGVMEGGDIGVETGEGATEAAFRTEAPGRSVIHLACHGIFRPETPLLSSLVLAGGGGEDGRMEAREIFGLDLEGSRIVVLSACRTGLGTIEAGDEVVGLVRSFFFAGSPTVVASLWEVPDRSTSELMRNFHANLTSGMTAQEAMRSAQISLLRHPFSRNFRLPLAWAPFQVYGDVR